VPSCPIGPVRLVNGFPCRNCADEELARRGVDPAHPQREFSGNEVYVPPPENRVGPTLGANQPNATGSIGRHLDLRA